MRLTPADYAGMSLNAYENRDAGAKNLPRGFERVVSGPNDGFFGAAYYSQETGELVISYRGTDSFSDWIRTNSAFLTDSLPNQFQGADAFVGTALAEVARRFLVNVPPEKISLTGHSLGGALAQLVSAATGYRATVFNSPGVGQCLQALENYLVGQQRAVPGQIVGNQQQIAAQIELYRASGDVISQQGVHIEDAVAISVQSPPFNLGYALQALVAGVLGLSVLMNVVFLFARRSFVDFHEIERLYDALQKQYGVVPAVDDLGQVLEEGSAAYEAEYERQLELLEELTGIEDLSSFGTTPVNNLIADLSPEGQLANGTDDADLFIGADGGDTIVAGAGDDLVYGGSGDDWIEGNSANDELVGGGGRDVLNGGAGSDTYVLHRGSYTDLVIADSEGVEGAPSTDPDRVLLANEIAPSDVIVTQSGADLYLNLGETLDRMILLDWMNQDANPVATVEFEDGTVWDRAALINRVVTRISTKGTAQDDVFEGREGNDVFIGLGGNDDLHGNTGDDYLDGGAGDDFFYSYWTDQTGDGSDIILGGPGNDELNAGGGKDLLEGGDGDDFFALYQDETVLVQAVTIGGRGEDHVDISNGVVAFNAGDGVDIVAFALVGTGLPLPPLTFSVGNTSVQELYFSREPYDSPLVGLLVDNLILNVGNSAGQGRIVFPDFSAEYGLVPLPQLRLQIISAENGIQLYDLSSVIDQYIAAGTPANWALASPLNDVLVSSSADYAIGGDIAYRYALNGTTELLSERQIREVFAFANYSTAPQLVQTAAASMVSGTEGNETIAGTAASDVLIGLGGNDTLDGADGSDTYVFGFGDGIDTVSDSGQTGTDTLRFSSEVSVRDLSLGVGSLLIRVGASGDAVHIEGFDPNDALNTGSIERFDFADGTSFSRAELVARGFDLYGTDQEDLLSGTNVIDRINAGAGDDVLNAGGGDDVLDGQAGADTLIGGAGDDVYKVALATGNDVIKESGGLNDILILGTGISPEATSVSRDGMDLAFNVGDSVKVTNWFLNEANKLEHVQFADGTIWNRSTIEQLAGGGNSPPVVTSPIADQQAIEGKAFTFIVPTSTFWDADAGDTLRLTAALADGSAVPTWLSFEKGEFRGTPGLADGGEHLVQVTATDSTGAAAAASFRLTVRDSLAAGERLIGTRRADVLNGSDAAEFLDGRAGTDRLLAGGGDDILQFFADDRERGKNRSQDIFDGGAGFDTLLGTDGHDALHLNEGFVGIERIAMGEGHDVVDLRSARFAYGDVILDGGDGKDVLRASGGNDVLVGGKGNDELSGGAGQDLYIHGLRGGHDEIDEAGTAGEVDVLRFGEGITRQMVRARRHRDDLVLDVSGPHGSVTVKDWFSSPAQRVEFIEFADDTAWDEGDVRRLVRRSQGDDWYEEVRRGRGDDEGRRDRAPDRRGGQRDDEKPRHEGTAAAAWQGVSDKFSFDFEAVARELDRSDRREQPLSREEIARRWAAVRRHALVLAFEADEYADYGAATAWRPVMASSATGFGFEASVGAARGPESLKSLEGLTEGFRKL